MFDFSPRKYHFDERVDQCLRHGMGGNLEAAGNGLPTFEVGDGPCLRPPIVQISEILSININVQSIFYVLF